jgi:hypothetical protein
MHCRSMDKYVICQICCAVTANQWQLKYRSHQAADPTHYLLVHWLLGETICQWCLSKCLSSLLVPPCHGKSHTATQAMQHFGQLCNLSDLLHCSNQWTRTHLQLERSSRSDKLHTCPARSDACRIRTRTYAYARVHTRTYAYIRACTRIRKPTYVRNIKHKKLHWPPLGKVR